jgi:hypothetical protein
MQFQAFIVSGWLAATLAWPTGPAHALGNSEGIGPKMQVENPCLNEVSKFEQTIGFIRQSQGNRAAADLKERLLPAKMETDILMKDGYCGLAKYLREKKLLN